MERGHWNVVELGYEPPLSLGPTSWTGRAAMLLGLVATTLIGVAAGSLLGGALLTAPKGSPAAVAPAIVVGAVPAQTVAEDGCGDPVVHRGREGGPGAAVRIEQLSDTGSLRPYTRISTLLAEIDPDAASDERRASALAQAHVPPPQLPPIILYGSAHATPTPEVSAYADPSPSLLTTRTPRVSAYAGPGPSPASRPPVVDPIDVEPIDMTTVPRALAAPEVERRFLVARPGDTLAAILAALGTTGGDAQAILTALAKRDGFGRSPLAGGEALTVLREAAQSGAPRGPLLKISVERSAGEPLVIARTDDGAYRWVVAER